MRIIEATLGMDATTINRDVGMAAGQRLTAGSDRDKDQFRLKLPGDSGLASIRQLNLNTSSVRAASQVAGDERRVEHILTQEATIGRAIAGIVNSEVDITHFSSETLARESADAQSGATVPDHGARPGTGAGRHVALSLADMSWQEDTLQLNTSGVVTTAEGTRISLAMELEISRFEYQERRLLSRLLPSRFVDPLVLSFDDGLGVFSDCRFSFDLNGDGSCEELAGLKPGSGFLVLDHNGDGLVNSGLELFGPQSGHGYGELRQLDEDGNNWIDENDPMFDRLQLWMGGGSDGGRLVGLKEMGVGALALASVESEFELKAVDGRVLGQVRRSGLFLTEAGEVRPLAEIDLAVDAQAPPAWPELSSEVRRLLTDLREMLLARRRWQARPALPLFPGTGRRRQELLLARLFDLRPDWRER